MDLLPYIEQQPTIMLVLSAVSMFVALAYLIKYFYDYKNKDDFSKYFSLFQSLLIIASLILFLNYSLDLKKFYLINKSLSKENLIKKELDKGHFVKCYYTKENRTFHINLYTDKYEKITKKGLKFENLNGHIYLKEDNKTFDVLNCFPKNEIPNNIDISNIPKNKQVR